MSTPAATPQTASLRLAHSPDSDDAFMFYALATGKVRLPGVKFTHVLSDIETLNQAARQETYDVTAMSFYGYAFVADKYVLLDCGASFGEGYGPIVVASHPIKKNDLAGRRVAIPGTLTTSYLALKLFEPNVETVTMPFDKILDAVQAKEVEAGLLIHEGQLLFSEIGLHRVVDLGQWWRKRRACRFRSAQTRFAAASVPRWAARWRASSGKASATRLSTARRRLSTPCSSLATWTPCSPTSLSACT